jgi:hypothetical protein
MGRFVKGQSGNPSGLPSRPEAIERRRITKDVRDLCRAHSLDAVKALVEVLNSTATPPAARVAAANSILDRGWGKPQIEVNAKVSVYDQMSEEELAAYIAGHVIEGEVIRIVEEDEREQSELLEEDED